MIFNSNQIIKRVINSPLIRSSGIYTISNFINAAIPLLLLPILTQKLSAADYGIVAMFQLAISAIYPFIGMNLEGAICRKYYDTDDTDFAAYIGSCFILFIVSSIIVSLVFLNSCAYIQMVTLVPEVWLKYILLVAICQFITSIILVVYQVKVQPVKYGILQISQTIFNLCITLVLIVSMNKGWEGRLESQIITSTVFALVSLLLLIKTKHFKIKVKKRDVINALKFGIPLIPHTIGGIMFSGIDRFFLTKLVGLEQTGNYTVSYQIGTIVFLITIAFNNAYVPWLFESLKKNNIAIKKKIVKFTYLYFILLLAGAFVLILAFPLLISIFVNGAYYSITNYSVFIVLGFAFQGMYFMVTNYIFYTKKTHIQAILTIFVGLIKLPITYYAIIWFGAVGASISYCVTFLIFFIATWFYSSKVYPMPWNIFNFGTKI